MADGKISKHVNNCLSVFGHLLLLDAPTNSYDTPKKEVVDSLREEEARFKVWAGNIGAHKAGRSSLDYRLRDASHIQEQVIELITDLTGLIESARAIIAGEKIPWDKLDDGDSSSIDDASSEADSVEDDFPKTELDQVVMDAADVIDCLLRLSVAIRNPAPHDRFAASVPAIDTDHFEPFDIQHVHGKFGQADQWLAARLGKAISRRRQYFKYRERHHQKLAEGLALDHGADHGVSSHVTRDGVSTIASSIPEEAKGAPFDRVPLSTVDEDALSDSGVSHTSFASSNAESEKLKVPPLPEEAHKGPFECPFCFRMITASSTISWRRHVFGDLRPYICLWEGCDDLGRNFARRHEWTAHELQNHWKRYACPLGCNDLFFSPSQCKKHLDDIHPNSIPPDQVDPIINLSVRPARPGDGIQCPLCQEALASFKLYQRHVGRHQEQLALFALPPLDSTSEGGSEADSEADNSGQSDADSSSEEYDETKAKVQKARVRAELDRLRSEYEKLERRMYSDEEPKDALQFPLPMREEERWLRQYLEETEEIQRPEEELENLRRRREEIKAQGATEGPDRREFKRLLAYSDWQVLDDLEQLRRFPVRGWWKSAREYVEKGRAKEAEAQTKVAEYRRLEEQKILEEEIDYQTMIEEANPKKKSDAEVEAMKRQLQQLQMEHQKKAEEGKQRRPEEELDHQKRIEEVEPGESNEEGGGLDENNDKIRTDTQLSAEPSAPFTCERPGCNRRRCALDDPHDPEESQWCREHLQAQKDVRKGDAKAIERKDDLSDGSKGLVQSEFSGRRGKSFAPPRTGANDSLQKKFNELELRKTHLESLNNPSYAKNIGVIAMEMQELNLMMDVVDSEAILASGDLDDMAKKSRQEDLDKKREALHKHKERIKGAAQVVDTNRKLSAMLADIQEAMNKSNDARKESRTEGSARDPQEGASSTEKLESRPYDAIREVSIDVSPSSLPGDMSRRDADLPKDTSITPTTGKRAAPELGADLDSDPFMSREIADRLPKTTGASTKGLFSDTQPSKGKGKEPTSPEPPAQANSQPIGVIRPPPRMYRPEVMRNVPFLTEKEREKYELGLIVLWNTYESSASDSKERAEAQNKIRHFGSLLHIKVARRKQAFAQRQAQQGQRSPGPGSEAGGGDQAPSSGFQAALSEELAISLDQSNRVLESHLAGGSSAGEDPGGQQDVDDDGGGIVPGDETARKDEGGDISAKLQAEIDQAEAQLDAEVTAVAAEPISSPAQVRIMEGTAQVQSAPSIEHVESEPEEEPVPTPRSATPIGARLVFCCQCDNLVNLELCERCPYITDGTQCLHDLGDCCPAA